MIMDLYYLKIVANKVKIEVNCKCKNNKIMGFFRWIFLNLLI